jgi:hypothetical protein
MSSIPDTPLEELIANGWPQLRTTKGSLPQETLRDLMGMLRNSIAHCNLEFLAAEQGQITGIRVWNRYGMSKTWEAELSIDDLRAIAFKFVELIEGQNGKEVATS